jgi:hypothetical protein
MKNYRNSFVTLAPGGSMDLSCLFSFFYKVKIVESGHRNWTTILKS